ncbi:hypothetical protein TNCV_45391 [Trichonephila clavipes]|nr:hypothetical protein TNCV_45391 [Trichonephila clavipes]
MFSGHIDSLSLYSNQSHTDYAVRVFTAWRSSREVVGREREVGGLGPSRCILPLNFDGTEPNRTVTCMVLKATSNDKRHLALCHDEFRGLGSVTIEIR